VLVLIAADPRVSGRAFEAMRIGAGVAATEREVAVVLTGPAAHLLDADTDALVEGDGVAAVRATLRRLGVTFHVDRDAAPADPDWNVDGHPVRRVGRDEIVLLIRRARRVLAF
jgi:hypothetical protein